MPAIFFSLSASGVALSEVMLSSVPSHPPCRRRRRLLKFPRPLLFSFGHLLRLISLLRHHLPPADAKAVSQAVEILAGAPLRGSRRWRRSRNARTQQVKIQKMIQMANRSHRAVGDLGKFNFNFLQNLGAVAASWLNMYTYIRCICGPHATGERRGSGRRRAGSILVLILVLVGEPGCQSTTDLHICAGREDLPSPYFPP